MSQYIALVYSSIQLQLGRRSYIHKCLYIFEESQLYQAEDEAFIGMIFFMLDVFLYSKDMLVFLDETRTDRQDTIRKVGYSFRVSLPECRSYWPEENTYQ